MQMLRENFLSKEALYQAESIKYNPMRGGTPNNGTDITDRTIFWSADMTDRTIFWSADIDDKCSNIH